MRSANSAVIALLTTGEYVSCELWTITLNGGTIIRWHSGDRFRPISYAGNSWAKGPGLSRGQLSERRGPDVATLELRILAGADDLINGQPIIPFIAAHGLDGATFRLDRAIAADWASMFGPSGPAGLINRFAGKLTAINSIQGGIAALTISSWMVLLNVNMPRNVYQAACMHTLYDSGCTVNPAGFNQSSAVASVGGLASIGTADALTDPQFYALGRIVFTSGANAGISRSIKAGSALSLTLSSPLPNLPAVGDAFTVYAGCDLTRGAGGCAKFANLLNYKGTDFVPAPQTPISIPSSSTTTTSGKGGGG